MNSIDNEDNTVRIVGPAPQSAEDDEFSEIDIKPEDPEELFEELEMAGAGNYGVVIKARNRVTGDIVAIKQILLTDKAEIMAVQKEIVILQSCDHPNIVRYYGTYKSLGRLWLVMEYCEGSSVDLVYKMLHKPLPERLIAYVCRQVLQGLAYLHEHHRIHRDIKGGNVLLTRDGQVKLADFGVSTELMHSMSRRNTFVGTVLWMAPEAILEVDYDDKADIWSLGITVIEMAENGPPRLGLHVARAVFMIPREEPPTLQHKDQWSPQMSFFIKRLLTKNKDGRPSAATMLNDPFVQPENIGTADEMKVVVEELLQRREALGPDRIRRGEFSSDTSTATFVERSSSDGSRNGRGEDEADRSGVSLGADGRGGDGVLAGKGGGRVRGDNRAASPDATKKGGGGGGGGGGGVCAAKAANKAASRARDRFRDGTLLPLRLISTEDRSFDELCYVEQRMAQSALSSTRLTGTSAGVNGTGGVKDSAETASSPLQQQSTAGASPVAQLGVGGMTLEEVIEMLLPPKKGKEAAKNGATVPAASASSPSSPMTVAGAGGGGGGKGQAASAVPTAASTARAPAFVMHSTQSLQYGLAYYRALPSTRVLTSEEADQASHTQVKYATALKSIYKV